MQKQNEEKKEMQKQNEEKEEMQKQNEETEEMQKQNEETEEMQKQNEETEEMQKQNEETEEMPEQNEETCPPKMDDDDSSSSSSIDMDEYFRVNYPKPPSEPVQYKLPSKLPPEIQSLMDELFDDDMYYHPCPYLLSGEPRISKFQPDFSTSMDGDPESSDETIHGFCQVSNCINKTKMCKLNRKQYRVRDEVVPPNYMQMSSSYCSGTALPENLLTHWSNLAFNFKAERFANIPRTIWQSNKAIASSKFSDIVCGFNILSDCEIIVFYEETRSCINVFLPELDEMEKRWLLEEKSDEVQDEDMRRLENFYREIMLDPERKDTFHKFLSAPETRLKISNNMDICSNATVLNTMVCHKKYLPLTKTDCKLATKIVEVDPESLIATIEQNTLLPLKLKFNAYMHLNEFLPSIIGLPYALAETKIVQSYEYGYLYEKLQNYFIATRDCSFVHFPDSDDEKNVCFTTFHDFKDYVESCPLYKTIEVPKTTSSLVKSLCTGKSYRIPCYENEAKKYMSKATNFKNCTFSELVKHMSDIRSSYVPESLRFIIT